MENLIFKSGIFGNFPAGAGLVDCQQIWLCYFILLLLLLFDPQGDTLQQGTEVSGCVVLPMSLQACRGSVWICTAVCPHVK